MSQPQVYVGTWEEIKRHESALAGRYLRVIVEPQPKEIRHASPVEPTATRVLKGMGKFKGKTGGTAAIVKSKQEDLAREETRF